MILNLINTSAVDALRWDQHHEPPLALGKFQVSIPDISNFHQVWCSSPDNDDPSLVKVPWYIEDEVLRIEVPHLNYWSLIAIELNG